MLFVIIQADELFMIKAKLYYFKDLAGSPLLNLRSPIIFIFHSIQHRAYMLLTQTDML